MLQTVYSVYLMHSAHISDAQMDYSVSNYALGELDRLTQLFLVIMCIVEAVNSGYLRLL